MPQCAEQAALLPLGRATKLLASLIVDVAERRAMNKARKTRTLAEVAGKYLAESFSRQGFTSAELVTHWEDIVGREVAALSEPLKIQWSRSEAEDPEPGTLVLRVQGPAALEIQHMSDVIIERVNRFLGWRAVGRLALRQAPLMRRPKRKPPPRIDPQATERIAATLTTIADEGLRSALARLGAAIKRT
jgi:hypothetical protein